MKILETIYVDFNNTDAEGRVRLITNGALRDIKEKGIILKDGLEVLLDDREDFKVKGVVQHSVSENIWVAKFSWKELTSGKSD
ncbi:hypothetical protein IDJ77_03705 [Mucilaginibacter sp. ZT4R22]|uniref:Uncharacterized protein n=1 Tax=Mucilaginibacter pankratovii TaxID=2772110 RepID=A0ABR7WKQ1_9SPHI|nr:hypothetical protein [Mucilaginibacter pankratovii]MBD1362905.1 hypothetical protein [Mucilaginibacter pankratovii]